MSESENRIVSVILDKIVEDLKENLEVSFEELDIQPIMEMMTHNMLKELNGYKFNTTKIAETLEKKILEAVEEIDTKEMSKEFASQIASITLNCMVNKEDAGIMKKIFGGGR